MTTPNADGMKCIVVGFVGHHSTENRTEAGADRVMATLADKSSEKVLALLQ